MKKKARPALPDATLRDRAEASLRVRHAKSPAPASVDASHQRLMHEFQVHQVELEMQNAELQEAWSRSETQRQKYTDLFEFAPVGYFSLDRAGRIHEVNLTGASLLGIPRSEVVKCRFRQSVLAGDRTAFQAFLAIVFEKPGKHSWEGRLLREGSPSFWADIHAVSTDAAQDDDRRCQVAVMDVSALKRAEAAQQRVAALALANEEANREIARRRAMEASLRKSEQVQRALLLASRTLHAQRRHLARQILLAQEEERRKISRELHDEIAQVLTGITVHLAALNPKEALVPRELRRRVALAQRLVSKSIHVVRRYARELRPSVLDDLGLIPALRSYVEEVSEQSGLSICFTAFKEVETLPNASKTMLYRVAQEALTNVARHARARNVSVKIRRLPGAALMEVRDDGRSFSADRMLASRRSGRLGLLGMRERVEMMDGRFGITSEPGLGTIVTAEIPWEVGDRA